MRGVIFDLDGTLIDTSKDIALSVNILRKKYQLKALPVEKVVECIGNGIVNLISRVLNDTELDINSAVKEFRTIYRENMLINTVEYESVRETLEKLKSKGIHLAVATNKIEDLAGMILDNLNLDKYFDMILGGSNNRPLKPDPAIINEILLHWKIKKDKMLYVGDSDVDVETAKNAGVKIAFFENGLGCLGDGIPDYRIKKIKDLLSISIEN